MNDKTILVVDDDPQMQLALKTALTRSGYAVEVASNGKSALELIDAENFDLVISDQRMPEMTGQELLAECIEQKFQFGFIMITAHGTINDAVEAMRLGAADFITKPFSAEDLVRVVDRVLSPAHRKYRESARRTSKGRPIVTKNAIMIKVLEVAEAVAKSDATVLIQGESGTGKELVARLVHSSSARARQPFVAVNCAALPENLLESELFGHEKGAFTGAQNRKIGKFELAHGGTLLLDEISEMDILLQAKLLRVLQEREVDRVGGRDPISIDVRVLATTNKSLEKLVEEGKFRADLYYRLNVIPLTLPPLRDRPGDVEILAEHFMRQSLGHKAPSLTPEVLDALRTHPWPGNVRELQNAVERAAILSDGRQPSESDFLLERGSSLRSQIETIVSVPLSGGQQRLDDEEQADGIRITSGTTVYEMERALILETLKSVSNNRTRASELLGISVRTLRNKLNEYRRADPEFSLGEV